MVNDYIKEYYLHINMSSKDLIFSNDVIKSKIYTIRGKQVMLDKNLAELYEVEIKRLNEQVKRNNREFVDPFNKILRKVYISLMDNIILKWIISLKSSIIWERTTVRNIQCMN
jgi:hypothetical protein